MRVFITLWLLLIAGCATTPKQLPIPETSTLSEQQQRLAKVKEWEIRGKIAVKSNGDSWSASTLWKQLDQHYQINLVAPFGQGSMQIEGDNHHIKMMTDDKAIESDHPQQLMHENLNIDIPITSLRFWSIGLPTSEEFLQQLDEQGQSQTIKQAQWLITLEKQLPFGDYQIPTRITMEHNDTTIRLFIHRWREIKHD